ncbi:transcriptional regulator [Desulfurococcus amylolyticus]|uniref:Transcriptional regulator-like protein n=1 Tax=Desulfurococcus amylolyticus DSM 16532 TaxID=768672 RepID=I3XQF6_DESAM|nr:transcriptional regulator [Desulfurococcus amylolyticus]AFL66180.1 transcriptional regulator-like protein [Desulfurococcus amylolyticus DSM 16532]
MKAFCMVLNRKIMPVIKSYLAVRLVKELGFTQLEAARVLGMKQSAVNYALTGKRKPKYYESVLGIPGLKNLLEETVEDFRKGRMRNLDQCSICRSLFSRGLYREVLNAVDEPIEEISGVRRL